MAISDKIKRFRELRGWSVPQLAEKMGIDKAGIYKWEDGSTVPGGKKLTAIAQTLGVSVNDLLQENITPVHNETAITQNPYHYIMDAKETFYRDLIENNADYSLIPKAVLRDYKIVPEKMLDMITATKDEVNKHLQEKHELIIHGYENKIDRLEKEKADLLAENERLQRQIPGSNQ